MSGMVHPTMDFFFFVEIIQLAMKELFKIKNRLIKIFSYVQLPLPYCKIWSLGRSFSNQAWSANRLSYEMVQTHSHTQDTRALWKMTPDQSLIFLL